MEEEEGVGHPPTVADALDEVREAFLEFLRSMEVSRVEEILNKWLTNKK